MFSLDSQSLTAYEKDQLKRIPEWLPYVGCQETKYFKQCFQWSTEECELSTTQATETCLKKYEPQWKKPGNGTLDGWRKKVSKCVVEETKMKLVGRFKDSMQCKNKAASYAALFSILKNPGRMPASLKTKSSKSP